ncbi:hypothetical protein GMB86_09260 [Terrilactibacillus sp. BCM23-1]|uniref:Purine catabolism PurC-like domain-containing protein n=1 Tax=Terrilactibacillus tamarindi TaxID=2599694 RepID=A0A6N8CQ79_9BACI|nr:PucR family transcriptional regulator [Terrilactibacillus tamarindi]MTT32191.1 hypothetical protein [Terrilactibacillus tamarindi]
MSGITVKEAMSIGALKKSKLVAGHEGVNNIITNVTVMEIPHSIEWLRGHELMITALYQIKDDTSEQLKLIRESKAKNIAALALCYPGLYYHTLDQQVLDLANKLSLPIIEVPVDIAYIEIITPLINRIQQNHVTELNETIQLQNRMNKILSMELNLSQFIQEIKRFINQDIYIFDQHRQLLKSTVDGFEEKNHLFWEDVTRNHFYYEEIKGIEKSFGYLVIHLSQEQVDSVQQIKYLTITNSLSLFFSHNDAINRIKENYQQNMLVDWLSGQDVVPSYFYKTINELGHNFHYFHYLMMLSFSNSELYEKNRTKIVHFLDKYRAHLIVFTLGQQVIILISETFHHDIMEIIHAMQNIADKDVLIAYTNKNKNLFIEGVKLYKDLRNAVFFMKRVQALPKIIYTPSFPLLTVARSEAMNNVRTTFNRLIEPLQEYDRQSSNDLVLTLEYLLLYPNQSEIPDILHIHRNTLTYRKTRIIDILGFNPFEPPLKGQFELVILLSYVDSHEF